MKGIYLLVAALLLCNGCEGADLQVPDETSVILQPQATPNMAIEESEKVSSPPAALPTGISPTDLEGSNVVPPGSE